MFLGEWRAGIYDLRTKSSPGITTGYFMNSMFLTKDIEFGIHPSFLGGHKINDKSSSRKSLWVVYSFCETEEEKSSGDLHWQGAIEADAGCHFVQGRRSKVRATPTAPPVQPGLDNTYVAVCLVHKGEHTVEYPDGRQVRFRAGQLFTVDCEMATRSHWSESVVSYLWIPRVLDRDANLEASGCLDSAVIPIENTHLASFLAAQLTLLRRHSSKLSPDALHHVLSLIIEIAKIIFRSELTYYSTESNKKEDKKILAVWRYIDENLHKHDLNPEKIAKAINCSRAQLYRIFEKQSFTVGEAIKDARLKRSLQYLTQGDQRASIGDIADACGFSDHSVFGKQFRQRFGVAPSVVRRMRACGGTSASHECELPEQQELPA